MEKMNLKILLENYSWYDIYKKIKDFTDDIYSLLPTISAGKYAEVTSQYVDANGNKAVVPQGWTVSRVPEENLILEKDKGLVIYCIPKKKVRCINWQNPKKGENLMRT